MPFGHPTASNSGRRSGVSVWRQIADTLPEIENDTEELRYVLRELAIAELERERNTLAAQAATDPAAYDRYRALDSQYRLLKAGPKV